MLFGEVRFKYKGINRLVWVDGKWEIILVLIGRKLEGLDGLDKVN